MYESRHIRNEAECQHCPVRARAICGSLSADDLAVLGTKGRRRSISRGQTLLWEGDEALFVANVIEGVLKLSTSTGDGREQIVGIVYPSDFIGRPFGRRTNHSVTALTDAKVCLFTRSEFDSFAEQHPELGHELLQRTLTELDRARGLMLLLGRKTAEERVATLLLEMASKLRPPAEGGMPEQFELPIGRQQMADILGLTIETVSRQLTRMRGIGLIDLSGRRGMVINDRGALEAMAEAA
jgi:CRP/FNR family transcriptional regulator, anaerobic regulatory protein